MNINTRPNYQNSYINQSCPNFTANNRQFIDTKTGTTYKTTTYFFREDLDWDRFVRLLENKYKDCDEVHVFNDACSDGHEPISLAIKLQQQMGDKSKKFFPIQASDYNSENIQNAKNGILGISNKELYDINCATNGKYRDYFDFAPKINIHDDLALSPKTELKEKLNFKQGDIFQNIEQMPKSNNVLLCRNFWRYLPKVGNSAEKLAQRLGEKLDSTSLVIIGEHDIECNTNELLQKNGFEETPVEFVFQKVKMPYKKFGINPLKYTH